MSQDPKIDDLSESVPESWAQKPPIKKDGLTPLTFLMTLLIIAGIVGVVFWSMSDDPNGDLKFFIFLMAVGIMVFISRAR
jgi:hypothetical protein